jgi:CRP/FNR family cyclic AMP-dependent transcriptional regulator
MITPELISRYPFFIDLEIEHLQALAEAATGITVETGNFIFHEGDELSNLYIVVEGAVGIVLEKRGKGDTVISAVGPGHVFAWSALVSPHLATASAKALTSCWLIGFDRKKLMQAFQKDCRFGYRIMQKIVQISRDRLLDARIESLVFMA